MRRDGFSIRRYVLGQPNFTLIGGETFAQAMAALFRLPLPLRNLLAGGKV
jgi:hypothetical protein